MKRILPEKLIIRSAHEQDLPQILSLFERTIEFSCAEDYTEEQRIGWKSSAKNKKRWLSKIKKDTFLVAFIDNCMVGFASLIFPNYLDLMYVDHKFQHNGIAFSLHRELEKVVISNRESILLTDASITGKPFFERQGYKAIRKNQVSIENAVFVNYYMTKTL